MTTTKIYGIHIRTDTESELNSNDTWQFEIIF